MLAEEKVEKASDEFYAALNAVLNGDPEPMKNVWSHGPDAMNMHPIGGRQLGWPKVEESWEQVVEMVSGGEVFPTGRRISVLGETAFTTCVVRGRVEAGGQNMDINNRSTDIYHQENGRWKMVHHHADIDPALQAAMERGRAA